MVDLMWRDLMFCQFFLRRETRKLMPRIHASNRFQLKKQSHTHST